MSHENSGSSATQRGLSGGYSTIIVQSPGGGDPNERTTSPGSNEVGRIILNTNLGVTGNNTDTGNDFDESAQATSRGVRWEQDVIDNEFLNRKKSKICCIYHKQRAFGESSGEEDSSGSDGSGSSSSESDGGSGAGDARKAKSSRRSKSHRHKHREASPNAYERQPRYKK